MSADNDFELIDGVEIVEMDEATSQRVAAASAQSGWHTPGCDCGHDGMGPTWHAANCGSFVIGPMCAPDV